MERKHIQEIEEGTEKERLQRQIDVTDQQIDTLVYELYGLTEEEIGVVERSIWFMELPLKKKGAVIENYTKPQILNQLQIKFKQVLAVLAGYPPSNPEKATQTANRQAELLAN